MTWTPEQRAQRDQWALDALDDDPRNGSTVDPLEAYRSRREREVAALPTNGHTPDLPEPDDEVELYGQRPSMADLVVNIRDYRAAVPTEIPWRCKPIAYSGGVTLVAGPPKAGKSTLTAQLQACCETGIDFAGSWPVERSPCLLVTEEGGVAVAYKTAGLERLDVFDRRSAVMASLTFGQVLDVVGEWAVANPSGMAFIDTLAIWAGIENENDASQATHAIAQVTALAQQTDLAVVLIHHARKAGGEHGEAIRGSGAILGTVDIAVEMSRVAPLSDDRYLDIQGRVVMPERFLLSFDRLTMSYRLENRGDVRLAEIEADLAGVPEDGPGLTRNDLTALWKRDARARTEQLVNMGRMRVEYVKSGRAWANRYWSIPAAWTPPMEALDV